MLSIKRLAATEDGVLNSQVQVYDSYRRRICLRKQNENKISKLRMHIENK